MSPKPKLPSNRRTGRDETVVVDVDCDPDHRHKPNSLADYDGPILCFHDPRQLDTTLDMTETTEQRARELGAVACSGCYRDVDGVSYKFPYTDGGLA